LIQQPIVNTLIESEHCPLAVHSIVMAQHVVIYYL